VELYDPRGDFAARPPGQTDTIRNRAPLKARSAKPAPTGASDQGDPEGEVVQECLTNHSSGDRPAVSRQSLRKFFGAAFPIPEGADLREPRVIYDPRTARFFLTVASLEIDRDQYQFFAVSQNAKDTEWNLYRIVLSERATSTLFCKQDQQNIWEFPSAGKNDRRWFITANEHVGGFTGSMLDIDKAPTFEGKPTTAISSTISTKRCSHPSSLDDSISAFFLSPGADHGDAIRRYSVQTRGDIERDSLDTGLSSIPVEEWRKPRKRNSRTAFSRTIPSEPVKGRVAQMIAMGPNGRNTGWQALLVQVSLLLGDPGRSR